MGGNTLTDNNNNNEVNMTIQLTDDAVLSDTINGLLSDVATLQSTVATIQGEITALQTGSPAPSPTPAPVVDLTPVNNAISAIQAKLTAISVAAA